jgi:hypothetical protein
MRKKTSGPSAAPEIELLANILGNGEGAFPTSLSRYLLSVDFSARDKTRMHDLAIKNQEGLLSVDEKEELLRYANVGCLLGILHSKARRSLKVSRNKATS